MWEFLALASGLAGIGQYAMRAMMRKPMRDAIIMPLPIILWMVLPFVLYGVVFPLALLSSTDISQALVAALLNYLWPTLTMLFGVAIVPGMKMTARLAVGIIMSIFGVLLANWADIRELKLATGAWLPYLLGLTAGLLWGFYSALICRWRERVKKYSVVPMGFTLLGVIFAIAATFTNQWLPLSATQWAIIIFIAIGPYGLGYLLWEMAGAHGATSTALGILGSAVPVSATICLSLADKSIPGWHIYAAAALLSLAAFVTTGIRFFPTKKNPQA
jgi:drug/metabolite transporter (DMT)-like permease